MKLIEILNSYSDSALDQISSDKIDEAVNLRLPRTVIIQEIASALSSLSYISQALAPTKPPAYSFLNLLLNAPDYCLPVDGFQEAVLSSTKELSNTVSQGKDLSSKKNYQLYLNILKRAWEDDNAIDRSEASILGALRTELEIWSREHLILEHHPQILKLWDLNNAYVSARNHFLITGIILTYENKYIIAEEVAVQIYRALGIELLDNPYKRLLSNLKREQLSTILQNLGFFTSGHKEEQVSRIIKGFVPPNEILEMLPVEELREYCRECGIQVSGTKSKVIENIIEFYANDLDLQQEGVNEPVNPLPSEPEQRQLENDLFANILSNLSNNQLYDILSYSFLPTSGAKEEKVSRIVSSPWSERNLLSHLRKSDLSQLCKRLGLNISGVKEELIERILEESEYQIINTAEQQNESVEQEHVSTSAEKDKLETMVEIPVPLPNELDTIKKSFPELDTDEQIILALIKDAKYLTELDIERVSKRHNLGWFLTRAHMSEIVAKLTKSGNLPFKIKSSRSMNIYEWAGNIQAEEIQEKKFARDIIDALRNGVVPKGNLELLAIGQDNARKHLKLLLEEAHQKKSPFKFIRGPYGAGKTFLCSWLREYAINEEFVVSTVNIGPDQPLSDLPVFYSGVINGLRTPEKLESSALVDILESWLLNIHKATAQIEGLKAFDSSTLNTLAPIVEKRVEAELANLTDIDPGFAPALRAFYKARLEGDQETASIAIAWLHGSRSMSGQSLREIGVKGYLEANQVFPRLRALLDVINGARYQGLLLIVDELELIRKFPHTRQREQALETLRLLIDESGKNGLPGCLLLFTGTDTFFEDDRAGLKSYEALSERISLQSGTEGMISMRQPIIQLEGFNTDTLLSVVLKVRDLHSIAYNWDSNSSVPNEPLKQLVNDWTTFGEDSVNRKPRPVIRELINILDLCEENPGTTIKDFVKLNVNEESAVNFNLN
jgi:hypothetical protein